LKKLSIASLPLSCLLACVLSASSAHATVFDVNQSGFGFSPANITIQVGDTVNWHWSSLAHTVTEGDMLGITGMEAFNQPLDSTHTLVTVVFDAAFLSAHPRASNLYKYNCQVHWPIMKGTIQVNPVPGTTFCFGDGTQAVACPCGNTGMSGHGCDNSASTGGGALAVAGESNPDTVILLSSGELPNALSIFLQGSAVLAAPAVFGDGLRCAGGSLKRLAAHNASSGAVQYPQGADPSITVRSAALGDPIAPGSIRYYQTYYRDPNLNFCPNPPGNSWNVTNGIQILWP
jgi:plastocyanin